MKPLRILGPFPPPYGGVAIHCVRLLESLKELGVDAEGVSLGGLPGGLESVRAFRPWHLLSRNPVHYHTDEGNFRWMLLMSWFWRMLGVKYIVTVHSFRHRKEFEDPRTRTRLASAYKHAEAIVAISNEVLEDIQRELGIAHKRSKVVPSNLPVSAWEQRSEISSAIPLAWTSSPVRILANAGAVTLFQGKDLYGIDVLLTAFRGLTSDSAALCIVLGGVRDVELLKKIHTAAAQDSRVSVVTEYSGALAPLVRHAHIVVRPTRTEGGPSLTISEAMEMGRWAIASDAVPRPAGCITFRNEDHADLTRAIHDCIQRVQSGTMPETSQPYSQALTQLVNLYQRLGFVSTTHTPAEV